MKQKTTESGVDFIYVLALCAVIAVIAAMADVCAEDVAKLAMR